MKIRGKLWILVIGILGSSLLLGGFLPSPAEAQKAIEWKALASWGSENPSVRAIFIPFVEKVNQRAAGRLKISWVGPEAVPPFEQLKPVREGLFNLLFTHTAYHYGEVAIGTAMDLVSATAKERRTAGLHQIMDEVYRKKANVTWLAGPPNGYGYHLMLNKKINKADLTGLKIRTSPFYDPMVSALGGVAVRVALGEVYTALEKGVADGIMMTIGALDYKWYEVVKYMVRPRFGDSVIPVLVNLNSWNRLPKDLQDLLTNIGMEVEEEGRATVLKEGEKEDIELQKRGMELCVLPPPEAKKFLDTFYQRSLEELVLKREPEYEARLKEAIGRIRK